MADESRPSSRWQKRLLVVSLAFNLLIVGAFVGLAITGGPKGGPQRFDLTTGPLTRAMDDDRRERLRDALRNSGVFRSADRANIRADMATILDTLRADQFDEDAFRAAIGRQRDRLQAGQTTVLEVVSAEISSMTPEERSAFADRLEEQLRGNRPLRRERSD